MIRISLYFLIAALFTALFGAVYERFSHEVYSYYMIYAFAIPLALGALPYAILGLTALRLPSIATIRLWNYGTATLTVGCIFKGVLDIYGTTNRLIFAYPIAAVILLLSGALSYTIKETSLKSVHA